MIIDLAHKTICCLQQGAGVDMTGSVRKRRHDGQLDTGSGDLGSQMETREAQSVYYIEMNSVLVTFLLWEETP